MRVTDADAVQPLPTRALAALSLAFAVVALAVYAPALGGAFVSDDLSVVQGNAYVHELSAENALAILDPWGAPARITANYAPVHLFLHALEWQLFGPAPAGYHVVNVVGHAVVAALLAGLLAGLGVRREAAVFGGAVFLLHPANVEAVAWIFQLKSVVALGLAIGALRLLARRPLAATVCFALALLTKPTAAFALPVAAVLSWTHAGDFARARGTTGWLAAWALLLLAYAAPQFATFAFGGETDFAGGPAEHVRTVVALVARYGVMVTTTWGLSTFQQPAPAASWLDPWWLAGLAVVAGLGARLAFTLARRRSEAAFWVWAAAAHAPTAQVFPFQFPVADRYLYFILPGLIGAALLWARSAAGSRAGLAARRLPRWLPWAAAALVLVALGARSLDRARLWRLPTAVMLDAARHYPDGVVAARMRLDTAARRGDAVALLDALEDLQAHGAADLQRMLEDPLFAPLREEPRFQAVLRATAEDWIAMLARSPSPSQLELRMLAMAHEALGDREAAIRSMERALEAGGPWDARIRDELHSLRRR